MFQVVSSEHRMVRDSVHTLFSDLAREDSAARERGGVGLDSAAVAGSLSSFGLFAHEGTDGLQMTSAQVQAQVSFEAGAACLRFPVLEVLVGNSLATRVLPSFFDGRRDAAATVCSVGSDRYELPVLNDGCLHGVVRLVPFAASGLDLMTVAREGGAAVLAWVRLSASDSRLQYQTRTSVEADYPLYDIQCNGVSVQAVMRTLDEGSDATELVHQRAGLLAAGEIAGACGRMVELTRDYLSTRQQFGQVLGANQALKHALAECHVKAEALSAAVEFAAAALEAGDGEAVAAIAAAKHFGGRIGKAIADAALQLHGAIGYTMEFPLHRLMRRVYRLSVYHGTAQAQAQKLFAAFESSARSAMQQS